MWWLHPAFVDTRRAWSNDVVILGIHGSDPTRAQTADPRLVLDAVIAQEGGADVIELGVPFTDPQADGATIQATNQARDVT